jgi:hypothetical protein
MNEESHNTDGLICGLNMDDLIFGIIIVFAALGITVFIYCYKKFQYDTPKLKTHIKPKSSPKTSTNPPETPKTNPVSKKPGQKVTKMSSLYIPKRIGHPSGKKRVFCTSKGLRVYEVNERGTPLPH